MIFFKPKFWDKNKISFFAILLFPFTLFVKLIVFFKPHLSKKHFFSIPIICVGNIYLGGTGKTPLSIEIFNILKKLKMNPAFIRKKYKSFMDESELQKKTGPMYQSEKRLNAINEAVKDNINIAILDDGFQDNSIAKNFSILCFNEKQWIGNGLLIPAGPLRENLSSLKRAQCVIINGKKNIDIENKILKYNSKITIFYSKHKPLNINDYKNKNITAFAGIANPENFFQLLKNNNINIIEKIKFPDHYNYSKSEIETLIYNAEKNNTILLTTEKDYCRIHEVYKNKINYLKIVTEIENQNQFIDEIKKII